VLTLVATSEDEQEALGARLARNCPPAFVIFLEGALGTGKTTLARGFLRGLGYTGAVRSPTYTLLEPYPCTDRVCHHLDLYRVNDAEELEYLGLRDLLTATATLLVEWPERGADSLPAPDLRIRLDYLPAGRCILLEPVSVAGRRVVEAWWPGSLSD
jgi:tRNA threonylcarbamoyladenosine biosynthesis protein TsaE